MDEELARAAEEARIDQKDQAIRVLRHDLLSGIAAICARAELVERCIERGDYDRALHHARLLRAAMAGRVALTEAATKAALGM